MRLTFVFMLYKYEKHFSDHRRRLAPHLVDLDSCNLTDDSFKLMLSKLHATVVRNPRAFCSFERIFSAA